MESQCGKDSQSTSNADMSQTLTKVPRLPSNLDQIKELLTLCTADELRLVIASCNGILSEISAPIKEVDDDEWGTVNSLTNSSTSNCQAGSQKCIPSSSYHDEFEEFFGFDELDWELFGGSSTGQCSQQIDGDVDKFADWGSPSADSSTNRKLNVQDEDSDWNEDYQKTTCANVIPWWNRFDVKDIVAFDCEHVIKLTEGLKKYEKTQAATVDIVSFEEKSLYSTKIYHPAGSFQVHRIWRDLTGFNSNSFASSKFPTLYGARETVRKLLKGKLVVTVGGDKDFASLGLDTWDFETFDLQDHFFATKSTPKGEIREPLSLRSLSLFYLGYNPQEHFHDSAADALATMRIFKLYCDLKTTEDPMNVDSKYNSLLSYNHIPRIPGKF